ncbi:MAG: nitrous oxide reductase family maturation protein NosD, partial [Thiohalorhabdus sp.]
FSLVWAPELEKALLAGRMDGELQLWTYDPDKDVWGRFFLDGGGPTDAHGKWSTLVRDRESGLYTFLAADSEDTSQVPETWVFRLSGKERKVSRCPYDACVGDRYLHGSLQAALDAAPEGGTVGVAPGTYRQCGVIERAVTLKPLEGRPHLRDEICKGKGVLVVEAPGRVVVEGLEVSGASREKAIWMHQGAGELVLRDLKVHDSGMGVLAVPGAGSLRIYDSEIYAIDDPGEHAHFVYGGENAELVLEGNYLHGGSDGHFIKAKSVDARIRYNFIHQQARTDANIINIWGCGENQVVGNAIRSGAQDHPAIAMDFTPRVNYGERVPCPVDHARAEVAFNSYLKEGRRGWSALVMDKVGMDLVLKNNVVAGASLLHEGGDGEATLEGENARVQGFEDRLLRPARPIPAVDSPVVPDRQYTPVGTEARENASIMGAYGTRRREGSGVAGRHP